MQKIFIILKNDFVSNAPQGVGIGKILILKLKLEGLSDCSHQMFLSFPTHCLQKTIHSELGFWLPQTLQESSTRYNYMFPNFNTYVKDFEKEYLTIEQ